jgi:hypothetical protein
MLRYTLQWQKNIGLCIACSQYGQQLVPGTMGIDQQQTGFFQVCPKIVTPTCFGFSTKFVQILSGRIRY